MCLFQTLWQKFKESLLETAVEVAQTEPDLQEEISTDSSTSLPTGIIHTHWQYTANYVCLMMELRLSLPMGEDQSVPLITEVFPPIPTSHVSFSS